MISLKNSRKLIILISSFFIVFALGGCTTGNFGRLQSDREITQAFKDLKVLPDHKYYYRGTFSLPTVIVGIHKKFTLNLTLWTAVDPQSDDFKTLVHLRELEQLGLVYINHTYSTYSITWECRELFGWEIY